MYHVLDVINLDIEKDIVDNMKHFLFVFIVLKIVIEKVIVVC